MKMLKEMPELKLAVLLAVLASMLLVVTPVRADDPVPEPPVTGDVPL